MRRVRSAKPCPSRMSRRSSRMLVPSSLQSPGLGLRSHERVHLMTFVPQAACQVGPYEAAGAGDQNARGHASDDVERGLCGCPSLEEVTVAEAIEVLPGMQRHPRTLIVAELEGRREVRLGGGATDRAPRIDLLELAPVPARVATRYRRSRPRSLCRGGRACPTGLSSRPPRVLCERARGELGARGVPRTG